MPVFANTADENAITDVIKQYNIAYENERLDLTLRCIDRNSKWFEGYERNLTEEFKTSKFISMNFVTPLKIEINGKKATVKTFGTTYHFEEKDNFLWLFQRGFTYNLVKEKGKWRIKSLSFQIYPAEKLVELALHELRKNKLQKAMESLGKAREINPKWETAYFLQAYLIYHVGKNYENALGGFSKTIDINPNYPLAYYYAAKCLIQQKKIDQAIDICTLATEVLPKNKLTNYYLALTYEELGRYDEAIEVYNKLIILEPDLYLGYYGLGTCYLSKNMFNDAIKMLEKASDINPNNVQVLLNLSATYIATKQYDNVIKISDRIFKINKKEYIANFYLGQAYMSLGDKAKAKAEFEKVIDRAPNSQQGKYSKTFLKRLNR